METTQKTDIDKALLEAYDYIANVITRQRRTFSADDMYRAYSSMNFKPTLKRPVFEDYYYQVLSDWTDKGFLKVKG